MAERFKHKIDEYVRRPGVQSDNPLSCDGITIERKFGDFTDRELTLPERMSIVQLLQTSSNIQLFVTQRQFNTKFLDPPTHTTGPDHSESLTQLLPEKPFCSLHIVN